MLKEYQAKLLTGGGYLLAEGPAYDPERNVLSWVDIKGCTLYRRDASGTVRATQVGQYLGAALPMENGEYLGVMTTGLYVIGEERLRLLCRPEELRDFQRANDAKADPCGRAWFGTMPLFSGPGMYGDLYCYDGKRCRRVLTGLGVPNGMAWSLDGKTMYFIDTLTRGVDAFDYDLRSGEIGNRRRVIGVEGLPDGMCIDRDGMLWVALWGSGCVGRFDPSNGRQLARVPVPAKNVSSCCFAGEHLERLVITTSGEGFADGLSGSLFVADVETCGAAGNGCFRPL